MAAIIIFQSLFIIRKAFRRKQRNSFIFEKKVERKKRPIHHDGSTAQ